jgi:dsRNA-specific ribonuclease
MESSGADKDSILSSTLEAVLAAVFRDGGFHAAYDIIETMMQPLFDMIGDGSFSRDFKTRLQKYTQEVYKQKPVYRVTNESGPDHNKIFEVEIVIKGEVKAEASGNSKKQAEQNAAEKLLKEIAEKNE